MLPCFRGRWVRFRKQTRVHSFERQGVTRSGGKLPLECMKNEGSLWHPKVTRAVCRSAVALGRGIDQQQGLLPGS